MISSRLTFLEYQLIRAIDSIKDQSFFLCHLKESILPMIEFPIGQMMKSEVKRLANEMDLERIAKKDESKEREQWIDRLRIFFRHGFMFYWQTEIFSIYFSIHPE